jgi:hypothetical protein
MSDCRRYTDTSRAAWDELLGSGQLPKRERLILAFLSQHRSGPTPGRRGWTSVEIAERLGVPTFNWVQPRISGLKRSGLIRVVGRHTPTDTNQPHDEYTAGDPRRVDAWLEAKRRGRKRSQRRQDQRRQLPATRPGVQGALFDTGATERSHYDV